MKHLHIIYVLCLVAITACDDSVIVTPNDQGDHFDAYCKMSGGKVAAYVDSNGTSIIVDDSNREKLASYNYKYGICQCGESYYCVDSGCTANKDNKQCNFIEKTQCTDGDTRCINRMDEKKGKSTGFKQKCDRGVWKDTDETDLQACQDLYTECLKKSNECKDEKCKSGYLCDTDLEICQLRYAPCEDASCTYSDKHQFDICGECQNYTMRCQDARVEQCQNGHYEMVQDCTNLNGCVELGGIPEFNRVPHCAMCEGDTAFCAVDENGNGIKMVCANKHTTYDGKCADNNSCIIENGSSQCGKCHNGNTVCTRLLEFDDKLMTGQMLYIKAACENGQYAYSDENINIDAALQSPDLLFYDSDTCNAPAKDSLCITYNGNSYMYQSNGSAYTFLRPCLFGCLGDACNDNSTTTDAVNCQDTDYRCEKNTLQVCTNGSWNNMSADFCNDKCELCIEMLRQCSDKPEGTFLCREPYSYQCVNKDRIEPDFDDVKTCEKGQICTEDNKRCTDFCIDKEDGHYCYGGKIVQCSNHKVENEHTVDQKCNVIDGIALICNDDGTTTECSSGQCFNGTACAECTESVCHNNVVSLCNLDENTVEPFKCLNANGESDLCAKEKGCLTSLCTEAFNEYSYWDEKEKQIVQDDCEGNSCSTDGKCGDCKNDEYKCNGKNLQKCIDGAWTDLDKNKACNEEVVKACIKSDGSNYTVTECLGCDKDGKCQLNQIDGAINKGNVICRRSPQDRSVDGSNCQKTQHNCNGGEGYYINECQTNLVKNDHGYNESTSYKLKEVEPAQALKYFNKLDKIKIKSVVPKNYSDNSKLWYQIQLYDDKNKPLKGIDSTCFVPADSVSVNDDVSAVGFMYSSGSTNNYCLGYEEWACKTYVGTDSAPIALVGTEGDAALSVANILKALKKDIKDIYNPLSVSLDLGKYYDGSLTNVPIERIADYLKNVNVNCEVIKKVSKDATLKKMIEVFQKGGFVLALQQKGYWALNDMYITVYGVTSDGGSVFADDPMNRRYRQDGFDKFYDQNRSLLAITNKQHLILFGH